MTKYVYTSIFFKKLTAILVLNCFLFSFVYGSVLAEISANVSESEQGYAKFIENKVLPSSLGQITYQSNFDNSPIIVINIQDLHGHSQTQKNIAKIIEFYAEKYELENIFAEGAYGDVDTGWLESEELQLRTLDRLLSSGRLTGAEYYAAKNGGIRLKGLEDEAKHKLQIERLGLIFNNQERYREVLHKMQKELNYLYVRYANSDIKSLQKTINKYKNGKIPQEKFYSLLLARLEKIRHLNDYPNISSYLRLSKENTCINGKKLQSEIISTLDEIKNAVPYSVYKQFQDDTLNFQDGDLFAFWISRIEKEYNLNLTSHKNLQRFIVCHKLKKNVNPIDLIYEEQKLIETLRRAYSRSQREYEIVFIVDFFERFSGYLQNSLMPQDYGYFTGNFERFKQLYPKYVYENHIAQIAQDFDLLNAYHKLNEDRNEIFLNNLMAAVKPLALQSSKQIKIIVAGGYHSPGLQKLLNERGISNITVTPAITGGIDEAHKIYSEIIRAQASGDAPYQPEPLSNDKLAFTIASQTSDITKFEMLIESGLSDLHSVGITAANLGAFTALLKQSFEDASYEMDGDKINFFYNGDTIEFNKNGKIISIARSKGMSVKTPINGEFIINLLSQTQEHILAYLQSPLLTPNIYNFLKELYLLADEYELWEYLPKGNGLTPEVKKFFKQNPNISRIDGFTSEQLRKIPPIMQNAALAGEQIQQNPKKPLAIKRVIGTASKAIKILVMVLTIGFAVISFGQTSERPSPEEGRQAIEEISSLQAPSNKDDYEKYQNKKVELEERIAASGAYNNMEDAPYYKVLEMAQNGDDKGLISLIDNSANPILIRLFASLYAQPSESEKLSDEFIEYAKNENYRNTKNNFELRAILAGVDLLIRHKIIAGNPIGYHSIQANAKIRKAVIFPGYNNADADMIFDPNFTDIHTIAHELAHLFGIELLPEGYTRIVASIDEMRSDIIADMVYIVLGLPLPDLSSYYNYKSGRYKDEYDKAYNRYLYDKNSRLAFGISLNNRLNSFGYSNDRQRHEEHIMARSFKDKLQTSFLESAGKNLGFEELQKLSVFITEILIKQKESPDDSQNNILANLVYKIIDDPLFKGLTYEMFFTNEALPRLPNEEELLKIIEQNKSRDMLADKSADTNTGWSHIIAILGLASLSFVAIKKFFQKKKEASEVRILLFNQNPEEFKKFGLEPIGQNAVLKDGTISQVYIVSKDGQILVVADGISNEILGPALLDMQNFEEAVKKRTGFKNIEMKYDGGNMLIIREIRTAPKIHIQVIPDKYKSMLTDG